MPSMQQVLTSARHKLINSDAITPLLGVDIGQDSKGAFKDGWIFLGTDNWATPERNPANTGKAAVVLSLREPWSNPNRHNTATFRQLRVHILADMTRPTDVRLTASKDANFRCDRIATAVTSVLHDALNVDHNWPNNVYIVSCVLYNDLQIVDIDNEDGLVSGDMSFALELG